MSKQEFVYPGSDFDRSRVLLSLLGTFWAKTYIGTDQLRSYVQATGNTVAQSHQNLLETVAAMSRFEVPLFHREFLWPISVKKSQLNSQATNSAKFDRGAYTFDGAVKFDVPLENDLFAFPVARELQAVKQVFNKLTFPTAVYFEGVDFFIDIDNAAIRFTTNPFENDAFLRRPIYSDNNVVDEEITLWGFCADFDYAYVFNQFAYAVGIHLKTSENYKQLVNAIITGLIDGGASVATLDMALAAICGVPLTVEQEETVEIVATDSRGLFIATDKHIYRFRGGAEPLVVAGAKTTVGAHLVRCFETKEFFTLNSYRYPEDSADTLPQTTRNPTNLVTNLFEPITTETDNDIILNETDAVSLAARKELLGLAVDKGLLAACFLGDLVFENKSIPLEVQENHPSGYTYVRFGLGGFPADATQFFDEIHARGIELAETVENLTVTPRPEQAILCWGPPPVHNIKDVLAYSVGYSADGGKTWVSVLGPITERTLLLNGLDDTIKYVFRVAAVFTHGLGPYAVTTVTDIKKSPTKFRRGTLAHVLDTRAQAGTEPTAARLPTAINPMRFLIENVLRNNVFIVRIVVSAVGPDALKLYNVRHLRRILPPQTAMLVVFDLDGATDKIQGDIMLGEAQLIYKGAEPRADAIDDSYVIDAGATLKILSGTCQ